MKVKVLVFFALLILVVYLLIVIASQWVIDRVIFYPPHTYQDVPEILKLKTEDGKSISALYLKNPQAKYTILYSHGNAEDLGTLYPHLTSLYHHGFSVLAYDYHGYGTSEGKPTEKNVYQDINAAYHYLAQTLKVEPKKIILYGYSIGSGPSVDLAVREPIAAIILHSPIASVFRMLFRRNFLVMDPFNNVSKMGRVKVPILLLHGKEDEVVPLWHSELLLKRVKAPVQHMFVDKAHHNDLILWAGPSYWQMIQGFVKTLHE